MSVTLERYGGYLKPRMKYTELKAIRYLVILFILIFPDISQNV